MEKLAVICVLVLTMTEWTEGTLYFQDGGEHDVDYTVYDDVYISSNTSNGAVTTVNIEPGADVQYNISVRLSGVLNITGGIIRERVYAGNQGKVSMLGGEVADYIRLNDHAIFNWSGGIIGDYVSAENYAEVYIHGYGFNHDYGEITYSNWQLTGFLKSGEPIDISVRQHGDAAIYLAPVPEPCNLVLLSLGGLALMRKRRVK